MNKNFFRSIRGKLTSTLLIFTSIALVILSLSIVFNKQYLDYRTEEGTGIYNQSIFGTD